jgi:phosphoglycolate phosphatase-like HAD superfamily hydrolase
MRVTGVLLDVDGTLIDSNDAHANAWVDALREADIEAEFSVVRRLIGMGGDKLLPKVAHIDAESLQGKVIATRCEEIFHNEYLPGVRAFPAVKKLLKRMREAGLELAVASSAKKAELDSLLRIADAGEFIKAKTSSDDASHSKPDPDIIHAALKQLGQTPENVVLLGDTPYDVEASLKAGIGVVAVRCGGWADYDLRGAVQIYDDPADLLHHFEDSPFTDRPQKHE